MSAYEFGPFQLDAEQLLLLHRGEPVALGPKVVETLLALVERPGEVLAKSVLLDRVWPEGYVDEANLAQNVYVLRKVLRAHWDAPAIETVPRRGYRFTAQVVRTDGVRATSPLHAEPVAPRPEPVAPRRRAWEAMVAAVAAIVLVAGTALALASPHRAAAPPLSPAGARLYELGRYYWNTRSRDGVRKSIEYFSQVIATDPRDARGYAGLAAATAILGDYDYGPAPAKTYYAQARAYAEKALALDPRCARAYAVLGMLSSTSDTPSAQELADAIRQLRHAIELDSSDGPAHEWYGVALLASGRVDEAYGELQKASALDPSSVATTHWLGEAAYFERRYDDAIAYERQALDLAPHFYEAMGSLGLAYEARGDDALAIASFQRMARGCPSCRPEAAALLANVYAHANRPAQARSELAIAAAHPSDVSPEDLALAFAAVGERRVALSWFHRLHGNYAQATLAIDPRFDALRDDPMLARFAQKPA